MNKKTILVVSGQHADNSLKEWSGMAHPFHVKVVNNDERAIETCHLQQFDLVIIDTTDADIDEKKLNAVLPILQEDSILIQYEGESAENLSENIDAVFNAKKYRRMLNMIMLDPAEKKWNLPQFSLN